MLTLNPPPYRTRKRIDLRRARWTGLYAWLAVPSGVVWE